MQDRETIPALIQIKRHQPSLPVDLVPRPRLITWLEERGRRPFTLVSAPAGYGKSTLISCWLEIVDCPTAWVSLNERDNQLKLCEENTHDITILEGYTHETGHPEFCGSIERRK